jgi:hypothetical protein
VLVARARNLSGDGGDPVSDLVDLFKEMPGDDADWRSILEEPYG